MSFFDGSTVSGLDRFSTFQNRRELRRMQRTLWKTERLLRVIEAHDQGKRGILGLTNERLLWVPDRLIGGVKAFPLRELRNVRATDADGGALAIEAGGLDMVLTHVTNNAAQAFAGDALQMARDQGNTTVRKRQPTRQEAEDPETTERLERLRRMYDRGSMTREEYLMACQQATSRGRDRDVPPPSSAWYRRW